MIIVVVNDITQWGIQYYKTQRGERNQGTSNEIVRQKKMLFK